MTTIGVLSDLHIDFGSEQHVQLPDTDVLILAGDIVEAISLLEKMNDPQSRGIRKSMRRLCDRIQNHGYKHVFAIAGNHEGYSFDLNVSNTVMRQFYREYDIEFLQDEYLIRDGVMYYGGTCWTNFNNGDFFTMNQAKQYMNDYRTIMVSGKHLRPEDTIEMHKRFIKNLRFAKEMNNGEVPLVVISHHAPSEKSIDPVYKHMTLANYAYYSNLESEMEGVNLWIHGHVHVQHDYMIGDTRVICNPYGYQGYETNRGILNNELEVAV